MEWQIIENKLYKKFKFPDFLKAIQFMSIAAIDIDSVNHHPEWRNVYNTVEIWLCTHDHGNVITAKDKELAEILDKIYLTL